MIPLAKATLLKPTTQVGGNFTTLQGVLLVVGVETKISAHNGMMYMDSDNIKVEFSESDFKGMSEWLDDNVENNQEEVFIISQPYAKYWNLYLERMDSHVEIDEHTFGYELSMGELLRNSERVL